MQEPEMSDDLDRCIQGRFRGTAEQWDVDAAWGRVASRTVSSGQATPSRSRIGAWRAAAALLIVAGSLAAWRAFSSGRAKSPVVSAVLMLEVSVPRGTHRSIDLPDGTSVRLGGGSTLRYPGALAHGARDVELDGEAFFFVAHDTARPFRVHAGAAWIRDVGTRFMVQSFAERPAVRVLVTEGRVELRRDAVASRDSAVLGAGMLGELRADGTISSHTVSIPRYTAWSEGDLVFDDATLGDVAAVLGRWFDVDVRIADPALADRRLSAEFGSEPLGQVLGAIGVALDIKVHHEGRTVTFAVQTVRR
jgi:transmembrane sensor